MKTMDFKSIVVYSVEKSGFFTLHGRAKEHEKGEIRS